MTVTAYVVDTGYLYDLFNVERSANDRSVEEVRRRFEVAVDQKSRIFVPLPCIFEVGDHIGHIQDRSYAKLLANSLCDTVKKSMEESNPWIIKPSKEIEKVLPKLCSAFSGEFVDQGIGMTDAFVIKEAKYLKRKYADHYLVHIWTKDRPLKSHEPDTEPNPFVGD